MRYPRKDLESVVKAVVGATQLARAAREADMSVNIFEGRFKFL